MIGPMKPMLASPPKAERVERLAGTHYFDTKLDGLRAIAYWYNGALTILNRSMRDVTHQYPELEASASTLGEFDLVLDGEIVANTGSFQDTAMRGKQNKPADIARAMASTPVTFVAFDVLYLDGADQRNVPCFDRRMILDGLDVLLRAPWTTSVWSLDPAFFEQVKALGMEGVIAKRNRSTYRSGRFADWIKFKAVRSITAIGSGYELGEGARAHFGAMTLALVNDAGEPVSIGRVGTGFNNAEILKLKAQLDAGVPVLCEIECLNVTKDGQLRFPVYKGMRDSELSLADARLDQLDDIPRC